ncbi:DUF1214 domain-containing protein [Flavobacterium aquicola]|uniref:DUF1214 domain-containing protein n=1 Tax=Flavobacterium aquicola TaxID=1682742 RepID=A0A3E0ESW7_9FLAO|nr:DUF1214 domain-containing protein [Flavobacterium aquicola]REH00480.1 hypothetical protein C8P67_103466 [Flavobacterium aquicola]
MALNTKTQKRIILSLSVIAAIAAGIGSAVYSIRTWKNSSQDNIGNWQTIGKDKDVNNADLLSIAQISVYATYPLTKKEVIYLNTSTDSDGNVIDPKSDYVISGKKFDARYWSITAYDQDGFLIKNPVEKYSYNFEDVKYEKDSTSYKINLSAVKKDSNWLPTAGAQKIGLVIRLYQPSDELRNNLNKESLPIIQKVK